MSLTDELKLTKPIKLLGHEALLNIYYSASCLKKKADVFFAPFGLTDVQFNLMMLIKYQCGEQSGLTQAKLSDMMLVNRANITSLVDRMEKAGFVKRTADPGDRRSNIVVLTGEGKKTLDKVEPLYANEVRGIMNSLTDKQQQNLISMLEQIREKLSS